MFDWIRTRLARSMVHPARPHTGSRSRLAAEILEDRTTPTVSAITSNFNGTAIASGDYLWFSSVAKVSGLGSDPTTVHVTDQTISFTASGTQYTLNVPDSTIVFDSTVSSASLSYSSGWQVSSPNSFSGNVFLSGLAYQFTSGLPGGIKNVVWSGDFSSDVAGLTIKWQWSAAVYTQFSTDPNALGVKPSDAPTTLYPNSHHAGTPEAFTSFVTGGARGGGGSNFTGSLSATAAVVTDQFMPPEGKGSLSGFVFVDSNRDGVFDPGEQLAGVTITLSWVDEFGNSHDLQTVTAADGSYSFTNLAPGTYSISEQQPDGYFDGPDYLGSLGGMQQEDLFTEITVGAGQAGTNYNFSEYFGE